MTIRNKILISIVASVCIAILGSALSLYFTSQRDTVKNFITHTSESLEISGKYLGLLTDSSMGVLKGLSKIPNIVNAEGKLTSYIATTTQCTPRGAELQNEEKTIHDILQTFALTDEQFELFYLATETDGGFVQTPDDMLSAGFDPRKRPWYQIARDSGGKAMLTEFYLSDNGNLVTTIAQGVYNRSGKFIGVLGIDINVKVIQDFLDDVNLGDNVQLILTENTGTVLYSSYNDDDRLKKISELNEPALMTAFERGNASFEEVSVHGETSVIVSHISGAGWHLIAYVPRMVLMDSAFNAVKSMIITGLIIICLLVGVGIFLALSIAKPLQRLGTTAQAVAKGNFNAVHEDTNYQGELKPLHGAMTEMVTQLVATIGTAEERSKEAQVKAEEAEKATIAAEKALQQAESAKREGMLDAAERIGGTVTTISQVSTELSRQVTSSVQGAEHQARRSEETATAMNEMNCAVIEVSRSAAHATEVADAVREKAKEGATTVRSAVGSINGVQNMSLELREDMRALGDQAESITNIMSVISDIADQTNLLALNAAIEAARAGEAGRGFAVVADEVRKLAEKTMTSTSEVGAAIHTIQTSVYKSVSAVDEAVESIDKATQQINLSGEVLNSIVELSTSAADQIRAIATASEEQSAASEEINRAVEEIHQVAKDTAEGMNIASNEVRKLSGEAQNLEQLMRSLKES